ncbi:MAG: beta-lactamase family protein [Nitrosarchaeum sp.]|nr:beta-lactamase family protein [Nitrosarchaeum sp.]
MSQNVQSYFPPSFEDSDRLAKIQALFPEIDTMYREYAEKNHFPGYAYGILLDGQLVSSGSRGFIDLDKKIPATSKSMFRIASLTKSFTAMAILKLRDEGKLKLDDPISVYIPEIQKQQLTKDAPVVTIRDLLIHSAGFPTDDPWADRKLDTTDEEFIALLQRGITFSTSPGTAFEYSNLGYTLLGYIIKKITGMTCGQFINTAIWQPIGMHEASWEFTNILESQLAHGYRWENEKWVEEMLLQDGIFGAMGGIITSIESFSRYAALHQSAWPPRDDVELGPIKRSSIREMHQPWKFANLIKDFKYASGDECSLLSAYGYGLQSLRDSSGRIFVGHNGGLPGFGSNWYVMPEYGLGVILFANLTYARAYTVNLDVLDKLIVQAQLKPRQLSPSKILKDRQGELLKLLPHWENALASGIFAENFFLDHSLDSLKSESSAFFSKAGTIISVGGVIPENQLRGHFILEGEKTNLRIDFALTPENPSTIQQYQIKEITGSKTPA